MKASELMIGDLVIWNGTPSRVHTITAAEQIKLSNSMELSELDYIHNLNIEPITLTPEILEKNGFVYDEIADSWYNDRIDTLYEDKNGYYKYVDGYEIRFDSVHKIQQYLRICGLNDLADNLKV